MSETELMNLLLEFVRKAAAKGLCRKYRVEPESALGYLWEHMGVGLKGNIKNPSAWVSKSARGHLRNYLRNECSQLGT